MSNELEGLFGCEATVELSNANTRVIAKGKITKIFKIGKHDFLALEGGDRTIHIRIDSIVTIEAKASQEETETE